MNNFQTQLCLPKQIPFHQPLKMNCPQPNHNIKLKGNNCTPKHNNEKHYIHRNSPTLTKQNKIMGNLNNFKKENETVWSWKVSVALFFVRRKVFYLIKAIYFLGIKSFLILLNKIVKKLLHVGGERRRKIVTRFYTVLCYN